ncbi:MAG: RNA polymerase sigma factor [Ktedonobacteraceae bacterium]
MSQFIRQGLEEALASERVRLVGLCAALTGNVDAAEDLAQEVLLEAWRSIERLRDVELFSHWLSGIARNVCLRWSRKQGRHLAHVVQQAEQDMLLEEQLAADYDIEVELERKELVELLDRTLALLPAETREVLVARYVEESSLAEVAERLGVQTGAVAMRLQRGKLALRRVLNDELAMEWQEYGVRGQAGWEETSIWCTYCGRHHLIGRFSPAEGTLLLTCPACGEYSYSNLAHTSQSHLFLGMKRVKPAVMRLRGWIHRYYRDHLDELMAPCLRCGQMVPLQLVPSLQEVDAEHFSDNRHDERGVYQTCSDCPLYNWISLESLALALPEGQRFYREHARIHSLPEQSIEADGRVAFVTRFESVTDQARFEVVSSSHRYEVVSINGVRR